MHTEGLYCRRLQQKEFRLLQILPAKDPSEPVACQLESHALENAPAYEALSYVWGDPALTTRISCNGQLFPATLSLSSALARLRLPETTRSIWADAICINQQDITERASQVSLMGKIYSGAQRVVVWLGDDIANEASAAAASLQVISNACAEFEKAWIASQGKNWDGKFPYTGNSSGYKLYRQVRLPKETYDSLAWRALKTLFDRQWFLRTWCVQEIRLSRDAVFYWGGQELSWSKIGTTAAWLEDVHSTHDFLPGYFPEELAFEHAFVMFDREWRAESLKDALMKYRSCLSTDTRDKVYGLLSLVEPGHRETIDVSYMKPTKDLYAEVAVAEIKRTETLEILSDVEHHSDYTGDGEYYSWTPLWHTTDKRSMGLSNLYGANEWGTCDEEKMREPDKLHVDAGRIQLPGIRFSHVSFTIPVMDDILMKEQAAPGKHHPFLEWWNEVLAPYAANAPEAVDALMMMAYTLTAGWDVDFNLMMHQEYEERMQFYSDYFSFIDHLFKITSQENSTAFTPLDLAMSDGDHVQYEQMALKVCDQRRLFKMENGSYGLGPACTREGDAVVVLFGGETPYVLRQVDEEYRFLGAAYVHDLMYGQLVDEWRKGTVEELTFVLY